jgi:hypothetical protein
MLHAMLHVHSHRAQVSATLLCPFEMYSDSPMHSTHTHSMWSNPCNPAVDLSEDKNLKRKHDFQDFQDLGSAESTESAESPTPDVNRTAPHMREVSVSIMRKMHKKMQSVDEQGGGQGGEQGGEQEGELTHLKVRKFDEMRKEHERQMLFVRGLWKPE